MIQIPTSVMVAVDKITPSPRNTKKHPQSQINNVAKSIERFGFVQPLVLDENNEIIIGHCRLSASKKLGMKEVPCVYVENLTEEDVRALRILDNKLNESDWDLDLLAEELQDIDLGDFEDLDFGIEEEPESIEIVEDEVPEVDEIEDPIVKLGQVWKLGNHFLMCGDSTSIEDVEKLMSAGGGREMIRADLIVTDPPYNVSYKGKTEDALTIENDNMSGDEFREFLVSAFERMTEILKEGGAFYVWFASREHINFETALNEAGLRVRQELIWVKNSLVLGRQDYQWRHEPCLYGWKDGTAHNWYSDRSQTTVLEFNKPNRNGEHPTMKPVDLIAYQIKNSSKKNDVVVDLFGGSGTTLIACEQLGRKCRTMELDEKYASVILKRWEKLTGQNAEKIN